MDELARAEILKQLGDRYGERLRGKILQRLLELAFHRAGYRLVEERMSEGTDFDVCHRLDPDRRYSLEVRTSREGKVPVKPEDLRLMDERSRDRYELEQARRGLRLEATKAVQELEGLRREYESREATVALAEEANAIARTRYDNGLSTLLELSDARLALDMARTGLAKTLYQYNVALADLDRVMGRGCPDDLNSEKE